MFDNRRMQKNLIVGLVALFIVSSGHGADLDLKTIFRQGTPSSPFITVVYRYADTMLQNGRDIYGPQQTGMFLTALDRETLSPLKIRPLAPAGVRDENRPWPHTEPLVGANPQLNENLLRLLYFLKELSGENRYAQAADDELKWFLKNTQSPVTGLLPWGEHLSWNVMTDEIASMQQEPIHELSRPWLLWGKCFELAPQESKRFALALWDSNTQDHKGSEPNSLTNFHRSSAKSAFQSPRQAGFYIRTWAEAYSYTGDKTFLKAIDVLLTHFQKKGLLKIEPNEQQNSSANACEILSLAIDCDGAARKVPEPLRTLLTRFAASADEKFCLLPHDLKSKKGFVMGFNSADKPDIYTPLWDPKNNGNTTAKVAMMCVSRYENTAGVKYRDLIIKAADAYMNSLPGDDVDAWPMTFGHAISLQLAAFRATTQEAYYKRAFKLAETAVEKFFGNNPLPRASLKTDYYDNTTGADTLALALAELHLSILHITAVRTPANTIDR